MTYAKGSSILAADYNNFTGGQEPTVAFASGAAATNKASGLFGVGYGDRGYGQTGVSLPAKSAGNSILASNWSALRSAINTCASHQGTAVTLLPPAASAGGSVIAHEQDSPSSNAYDYQNMLANIDTNRFNTNSGASMTLTGAAHTVTRATTWGAAGGSITAEVTVTFTTEDKARYFFNSGGEIRFVIAHPTGAGAQDTNWRTVVNNLGTLAFKANSFTRSGSGGTVTSIGYYGLTTAYQRVLDGTNIAASPYAANDLYIDVKSVSITGSNGAKGTQIRFWIQLVDQHTGTVDICSSGTNAVFSHLKATAVLSGIETPTFATTTNF